MKILDQWEADNYSDLKPFISEDRIKTLIAVLRKQDEALKFYEDFEPALESTLTHLKAIGLEYRGKELILKARQTREEVEKMLHD